MLHVQNISFEYDSSHVPVLQNISFTIGKKEKVGLIGPTGSGKSTLLNILAGRLSPNKGRVCLPRENFRIGYLGQEFDLHFKGTLRDYLREALVHLLAIEKNMQKLEEEMNMGKFDASILNLYGELREKFEAQGGYLIEHSIDKILTGVGLNPSKLEQEFETLSGGEKARAGLCRILLSSPDILLLDEPTNHLDIEGREWLGEFLNQSPIPTLLVSHDRAFLDQAVIKILELRNGKLKEYKGNYTAYCNEKKIEMQTAIESYQRQKKEVRRIKNAAEKVRQKAQKIAAKPRKRSNYDPSAKPFYEAKAAKAHKQAKAVLKRIEHLPQLNKPLEPRPLKAAFGDISIHNAPVARLTDVSLNIEGKTLFQKLSLEINTGDRVAIVGPNGIGKTTLIRLLLGKIHPDSGSVYLSQYIKIEVLDQERKELNRDDNILENILTSDTYKDQATAMWARTVMGSLGLSGYNIYKKASILSPGEKTKMMLARILLSGPQFLILDEPTNHLDLDTIEALEESLCNYPGTLLFATHDRYMTEKIASRVLFLKPQPG